MSTYWYLECSECKTQSSEGINHGKEDLQLFLEAYPLLRKASEIFKDSIIDISYNMYQVYDAIEFLDKHHEHDVYPISQYGDR